jgi:hypothetical protein
MPLTGEGLWMGIVDRLTNMRESNVDPSEMRAG